MSTRSTSSGQAHRRTGRSAWRGARARAKVLLVLPASGVSTLLLKEVGRLARRLGPRLQVLRVIPGAVLGEAPPSGDVTAATSTAVVALRVASLTQDLLSGLLRREFASSRVHVRVGELLEEASLQAAEVGAEEIVLPDGRGSLTSVAATHLFELGIGRRIEYVAGACVRALHEAAR